LFRIQSSGSYNNTNDVPNSYTPASPTYRRTYPRRRTTRTTTPKKKVTPKKDIKKKEKEVPITW
jgi:hypothetical protein